jgi:shikimate kinase
MGTGKSRIGWELSRILRLTFIDTDKVIERITCLTIPEILDLYGEATFRDYETEVVRRSLRLDRAVISTGGGTVVRDENRSLLAGRGPVVRLNATAETIYKRTRRHKRPLLEVGDPTDRIKHLLRERESAYREVASFTVESDDRDSSDVVADVVAGLRRWADRHPNHEAVQGQSGP